MSARDKALAQFTQWLMATLKEKGCEVEAGDISLWVIAPDFDSRGSWQYQLIITPVGLEDAK